ncbi:MAG: peptidylprolyl isomerase [Dehalococcoidia bacterium]
MAKKRGAPPKREVTRRRLARWQQERRRRRITVAIGVLIIAVVIGIVVAGIYATVIAPPGQLLTTVGGQRFYATDYLNVLRLYFPSGSSPQAPLSKLEDDELMRQGAAAFGIGVSADEIDQQIRELVATRDEPQSEEDFEQLYQQILAGLQLSDEEFRRFLATELLQPKLEDYLSDQVPEAALQVHVHGILVATEEEAETVIERLEGGEDFADIAQEVSLDSASRDREISGHMGWFPAGLMAKELDDIAFSLEPGTLSEPVSTEQGYWLIWVLEKVDNRLLAQDAREQLGVIAFGSWLEEERKQKVERNLNVDLEEIYQWAMRQIS